MAITALARKLICIIYHLLVNQELYEVDCDKTTASQPDKNARVSFSEKQLQDKVAAIVDAYYRVNQRDTLEGGG